MVLAAGRGTRLAPLTDLLPKPLMPFFDVPLIDFALAGVARAGIGEVTVNLHHRAELLGRGLPACVSRVARCGGPRLALHLSHESTLMGTGGGIALARPHFDGCRLLVVNGDIFFQFELGRLLRFHEETGAEATALLHSGQGCEHLRSTTVDEEGRVLSIGPANDRIPDRAVFAGAYVLEPSFYRRLPVRPSSVIETGFRPCLERGRAFGLKALFPWYDLGTWAEVMRAGRAVLAASGRIEEAGGAFRQLFELSPGRFLSSAEDWEAAGGGFLSDRGKGGTREVFHCRPPCYLGPEAVVSPESSIGPEVVLGAGARVAGKTTVSRALVLPGARVAHDVSDVVVGPGWTVP